MFRLPSPRCRQKPPAGIAVKTTDPIMPGACILATPRAQNRSYSSQSLVPSSLTGLMVNPIAVIDSGR